MAKRLNEITWQNEGKTSSDLVETLREINIWGAEPIKTLAGIIEDEIEENVYVTRDQVLTNELLYAVYFLKIYSEDLVKALNKLYDEWFASQPEPLEADVPRLKIPMTSCDP